MEKKVEGVTAVQALAAQPKDMDLAKLTVVTAGSVATAVVAK